MQQPAALEGRLTATTVKGAALVAVGSCVVLMPRISLPVVAVLVGTVVAASGAVDLWSALRRRVGHRLAHRALRRVLLAARGVASLAAAAYLVVSAREAVTFLVLGLGVYLAAHGLVGVVAALADRDGRAPRLLSGTVSLALGAAATIDPGLVSEGLVLAAATATVLVGVLVLAYGLRHPAVAGAPGDPGGSAASPTLGELLWAWVRDVELGPARRVELVDALYTEPPDRTAKIVGWWVMLVLSVCIATFAVLQDSTAVVIGAMLVAPLMVPILGLAAALVNGWVRRAVASTAMIVAGVAAAVALAAAIAAWAPAVVAFDTNDQITSRTDPTLLDLLIALAAGAAGAYATLDRRVASGLGGVAIAVALVPPLAVVGIAVQGGRTDDAWGAFLLFLTNFVAIVLAASLVFVLGGFTRPDPSPAQLRRVATTLAPFVALALVVFLPLLLTTQGQLALSGEQRAAEQAVEDWLGPDAALQVVDVAVDAGTVEVDLVGPGTPPPADALGRALSDAVGRPVGVTLAVTPVEVTHVAPPG
ncbi:DUF389 domain-containing protein [Cellulomonas sp. PhB143]|uniref:DUF389 domain-containing protein n=1 Tax=Cellulomonas sp. PhB143 TaxID=2485186 RepID=UPI000F48AD29|nr:DUF389 domain-containing protein [Cellulomonas sp. PhB143]ROS79026.1 putative hydrophobic protein (TIGR00271 family) [Cellulomonas sp. PhB143]